MRGGRAQFAGLKGGASWPPPLRNPFCIRLQQFRKASGCGLLPGPRRPFRYGRAGRTPPRCLFGSSLRARISAFIARTVLLAAAFFAFASLHVMVPLPNPSKRSSISLRTLWHSLTTFITRPLWQVASNFSYFRYGRIARHRRVHDPSVSYPVKSPF